MKNDKSKEKRPLNIEEIQKKLIAGYKYTALAEDRDIVAVLGNTGDGKSTLCNYLYGRPMKEVRIQGSRRFETVSATDIEIGHEPGSTTLYAMPILLDPDSLPNGNPDGYCLLDCPGFFDNRSVEVKILQSISIELAVRKAKQIKSVIIVMSLLDLESSRLGNLRELVKTLVSLFKDPIEMVKYSIFVITHKNFHIPVVEAREITIGGLNRMREHCEGQANQYRDNPTLSSAENLSPKEYDTIANYFSAILHEQNKIVVLNLLDNGESRKLIFDQINDIKPRRGYFNRALDFAKATVGMKTDDEPLRPIDIHDFNFSEYDEDRVGFDNALYHLAGDGSELIRKICRAAEAIGKFCTDISDAKARLVALNTKQEAIKNLQETAQNGTTEKGARSLSETIASEKALLIQNRQWIDSKKSKLNETCQKIAKINEELKKIDNDIPLKFRFNEVNTTFFWFRRFAWEEMIFYCETGHTSIPIIDVKLSEPENGTWVNVNDQRESGIYGITYQSRYAPRPAKASVTTFIRTKDVEGNRIRIKHIKEDIMPMWRMEQTTLESEIKLLESNNETLNKNIKEAETNVKEYEATMKRGLEKGKEDIAYYESKIVKLGAAIAKARSSGLAYLKLFHSTRNRYDVLVQLSSSLTFQSSLIESFTTDYAAFLSSVSNYQSCFDKGGTIELNSCGETKVFNLKDPITGKQIKDLVLTHRRGTPFDEHSLLIQFGTLNPRNAPPPFIFKHPDGTTESIEYLAWNKMGRPHHTYYSPPKPVPVNPNIACILQLDLQELEKQRDRIQQDRKSMMEKLEASQIDLEKVQLQIHKLKLDTNNQNVANESRKI